LRLVFGEHVALPDVLGPLAAREGLCVEGNVADQVERIEVLAQLVGDGVEGQPFGLQLLDDGLLALG